MAGGFLALVSLLEKPGMTDSAIREQFLLEVEDWVILADVVMDADNACCDLLDSRPQLLDLPPFQEF